MQRDLQAIGFKQLGSSLILVLILTCIASIKTADWAGDEWIRYLVRTTDQGMGQRGRGYIQPRTGVSPDTTTPGGRTLFGM